MGGRENYNIKFLTVEDELNVHAARMRGCVNVKVNACVFMGVIGNYS